jgi:putative transposase
VGSPFVHSNSSSVSSEESAILQLFVLCSKGRAAPKLSPQSLDLEEVGIVPSMGRTKIVLDNAMAESFIATLKTELVHRRRFPDREIARSAIFEYLEGFYNRRRLHSALSYRSPADYEEATMEGVAVA